MEKKAQKYCQMNVSGNEKGMEAFFLQEDVRVALYMQETLGLTQVKKFTPQDKKKARHIMAQMTVLDMILNDRNI